MTSYIAHYTKKLQVLSRKEDLLDRLIKRGAPPSKLLAVATSIIEARIRVQHAKRATLIPRAEYLDQFAAIDARIAQIKAISPTNVLREFGVHS